MRAELQSLRTEFRSELQNLRAEFRSDIHGVRGEIQAVRGEIQAVRAEMGRLFYWLMGTFPTVLVGTGGTVVTVLLRTR